MDWVGHALLVLKVEAGETLPAAVNQWRRFAALTRESPFALM